MFVTVSASLNAFTLIVQSHIVFYINIPARSLMTECLYKYKISDELLSISSPTTLTERFIETGNKNNCDSGILSNCFAFKWQVFNINYRQL